MISCIKPRFQSWSLLQHYLFFILADFLYSSISPGLAPYTQGAFWLALSRRNFLLSISEKMEHHVSERVKINLSSPRHRFCNAERCSQQYQAWRQKEHTDQLMKWSDFEKDYCLNEYSPSNKRKMIDRGFLFLSEGLVEKKFWEGGIGRDPC